MDDGTKRAIDVLVAIRSEHVERLHAVNGQFAIALLTLAATLVFSAASGAEHLARIAHASAGARTLFSLGALALFAAAGLAGTGLARHAEARGMRIRTLDAAIQARTFPGAVAPPREDELVRAMASWVNPSAFHTLVFVASSLLVVGAVLVASAVVVAQATAGAA